MTTKVTISRSYYGPIPADNTGQPFPKDEWPKRRPFSWVVRWFGTDGNRYSKSFQTRKECERFAETKQLEVREHKGDPRPEITLREYYKEHQELMKGNLAPKTLHMHLVALALLAETVGWDEKISHITTRNIERFRATRLKTGIAPASANREVKTVRRLFNLAVLRGYLAAGSNPSAALPMIKVGRKRPPYCGPEQFHSVLTRARGVMMQTLLVVIYTTGMRLREALNLTWSDVDFASGQVHVTRKSAAGYVQPWTPKDHEMRILPLPPQAITLLSRWQAIAPEKCPYVFMDSGRWDYYRQKVDGGNWVAGRDLMNNILRRFQRLCRKAGEGPYTIHDMRRSCITNWAQHLPIHVVQQLAGHSDIKTTQQFYLSVRPEDIAKAQKLQAALLGEIPETRPTDQLLTKSANVRCFPKQKVFLGVPQPPEK